MMTKMTKRIGIMAIGLAVASGCATTGDKVEKPIVAVDETPAALFDAGESFAACTAERKRKKSISESDWGFSLRTTQGMLGFRKLIFGSGC